MVDIPKLSVDELSLKIAQKKLAELKDTKGKLEQGIANYESEIQSLELKLGLKPKS